MKRITLIGNISASTKSAISRKSAQTLPNHPSEMGYSAEEIKRRFYQPILDAANSALAEIDRVVNEANTALGQVDGNLKTFIDSSTMTESYKLTLDNTNWVLNSETNLFEITIPHTMHGVANYKEVGVDMFLLDSNNKYISVNQFEVLPNADVKFFHETNSAGFVSIYIKREGFIVGNVTTDVGHVIGIAEVGKTNNYDDLNNKPNLDQIVANEKILSNIISGVQKVGDASHADSAKNATYSSSSGSTDYASRSDNAIRAEKDQYGVNISNGYCKQTGNYPNVKSGTSGLADKSKADEDNVNIKNNYARQTGTYSNMSVGNATRADSASSADTATKAQKDVNGANIHESYAKQIGSYPNMSVGNAIKADSATNASTAINSTNANFAKQDSLGRIIQDTYTTGCVIERSTIDVQLRVSSMFVPHTILHTVDLFRDDATVYRMPCVTIRDINNSNYKEILHGNMMIQISTSQDRCDYRYLYLNLPEGYTSPSLILLISAEYQYGCIPNYAYRTGGMYIGETPFIRYTFFDVNYDFCRTHHISVQFIY